MQEKKNLLFVLPWMPWPLNSGGNQAMFNGILALKESVNIHIVFPVGNKNQILINSELFRKQLGQHVHVHPYIRKNDNLAKRAVRYLQLLLMNKSERTLEKELTLRQLKQYEIDFINEIVREHNIQVVQVEMLMCISIVNSLPSNVRKIFVHHELGYVRKELVLNEVGANSYYKSKLVMYKIGEIGILNRYDDIIVLSSIDKEKLEKAGVKVPIHVSFAVVKENNKFAPQVDDYHNLVFIGTSTHRPNYLAVMWFLENCWQQLLKTDEHYKLKIIGLWDKNLVKTIESKYRNVIFTGFVDDLGHELKDGIMIVPITVGSGIRMKILEASNYGIPVVSTVVGAEGLPLVDGENAFVTDRPDEFVEDVLKLKDKSLRMKFVTSLNTVVRERYSLSALEANRCEIVGVK